MNSFQLWTLRDAVLKVSAILGAVCVLIGGAMVAYWGISNQVARKEADAQTIVELQERIAEMQKQLTAQEEGLRLAKVAAGVARGAYEKRLADCQQSKNNWVASACGARCALYVELADKCMTGMHELSAMAEEKP